jgi:hypothetical protein
MLQAHIVLPFLGASGTGIMQRPYARRRSPTLIRIKDEALLQFPQERSKAGSHDGPALLSRAGAAGARQPEAPGSVSGELQDAYADIIATEAVKAGFCRVRVAQLSCDEKRASHN